MVLANLGKEECDVKFTGTTPDVNGMKNFFTEEAAKLPATLTPGQYLVFVK